MSRNKTLAALLIMVATFGVLLACGASSNAAATTSGNNNVSSVPTTQPHFKVGTQAKLGNVLILTVNSFKLYAGDDLTTYSPPPSADKMVIVDVSVKNISAVKQTTYGFTNFTMQDATGQTYTLATTEATPPDGNIPAGGLLRGQMVYYVPKAQHKFTFTFDLDFSGDSTVIWDLTN